MKETARHHMIDALRGISAAAVALFHFNEPFAAMPDGYHRAVKWGWLGVSVFFVLSGFCIAATREKDRLAPFFARRLLRLLPPYWASLGVVLLVVSIRVATTGVNDVVALPHGGEDWIYTLAALVTPASSVEGMNWVYGTLGYEVAFYVLMGLLAFRGWPVVAGLLALLGVVTHRYPFDLWGSFGLGVACHEYTRGRFSTAAIIGIPCLVGSCLLLTLPNIVTVLLVVLLIAFPPGWVCAPMLRPVRQLGLFSYSLYLIHVPIGCYLLLDYLPLALRSREFWPSLLLDFILFGGSLLFAYGFYVAIERPFHQLARRIFPRKSNESPVPVPPLAA